LAVQDKGYYVLNDMFRYMPDVSYVEAPADVAAADVAQPNGYAAPPPQIADGLMQQLAQVRPTFLPNVRCHTCNQVLKSPC
jgi:hypothetical protein